MGYNTKKIDELLASLDEYRNQARPLLAAGAADRGVQEQKKWDESQMLPKVALGAGLAYLTGGAASMLPEVAGGTGATLAEAFTPTMTNIGSAIAGGAKGYEAKEPIGAAISGIQTGTQPAIDRATANTTKTFLEKAGYKGKTAKVDDKGKISYDYENPALTATKERLTPYQVVEMKKSGEFRLESPKGQTGWSEFTLSDGTKRVWKPNPPKVTGTSTTFKPSQELFDVVNAYNTQGTTPTDQDIKEIKSRYSPQETYWLLSKIKKSSKKERPIK